MAGARAYSMPADDPGSVVEAVDHAASGDVVRLVRGEQQVADVTPPDPDAVFRPLLAEISARAAAIIAAHPDPDDLDRWQRAQRLHQRWNTTGCLPTSTDYQAQLRKLAILSEPQIADQARSMVLADSEALASYPLPAR